MTEEEIRHLKSLVKSAVRSSNKEALKKISLFIDQFGPQVMTIDGIPGTIQIFKVGSVLKIEGRSH